MPAIKGSARRGRFPFFRFSGGGYTLVEMLAVMLILGVLAGTFTFFYKGPFGSPEKEARHLARWLTGLTTISNRTGRPFSLNCPGSVKLDRIEAVWQEPLEKDVYASAYGCVFSRYGGSDAQSLYSPQWSAMVPTITIEVSRKEVKHYVIVSRHGRVRTNRYPSIER